MTAERNTAHGAATLTASGIARLANVGRAAVSNWRRRYTDFPTPVGGTPSSPFFDAHETEQWLRRHGKLHQAATEHWAWRHIESYQPAAQMTEALGIAGAYLLANVDQAPAASEDLLTPKQLVTRLGALDARLADMVGRVLPKQWTPQLTAVLRTVDELGREQNAETAFEYLHHQYVTSAHSMSGLAGTPDTVAEVMLALAGSGACTFDFTSGTGSILRMAADQALQRGTVTHCYAQEINPQYALITLLRLWFVHLRARRAGQEAVAPVVHVGDSLLADALPDLRADVVVANFPFGIHDWGHDRLTYDPRWTFGLPPRTEPELAWVQHALAHLSPGGTAVVLMPPATALRPAGRRIRAELVRRGALRGVIALPVGLMPPTGIGLHVWVLHQPDPRQAPATPGLLVVDATAMTKDHTLAETIGGVWRSHLAGDLTEAPGVHRVVDAIDVLNDQVDLTPQRYLPHTAEDSLDPVRILAAIDDFGRLIDDVRRSLPPVRESTAEALRAASHAEVADLIRAGSVAVHRAVTRSRASSTGTDRPVLTSSDVLAGRPATGTATHAATEDAGSRVEDGDILIPVIGREIVAQVATPEQVGAELAPGVQLLRVDRNLFDPWFVAGVLSRTDNVRVAGRASSSGSGALRIDIRRLAIPVVPLEEQRAYGEAFQRLAEFRTGLGRVTAAGNALARDIGDGLTSGALAITP